MSRPSRIPLLVLLVLLSAATAWAGAVTPHLISFQGRALDPDQVPIVAGGLAVRIYDAQTGGTLVYDSGTEFDGAIADGIFTVVLGGGAPLNLDNTLMYWLELDLDGAEVIGDAAGGRQAFYPGGGSHARPDLEARIDALEDIVFFACDPGDYDLNLNPADGCEFTLDTGGIYVSVDDPSASDDSGCGYGPDGTGHYPCATISFGIMRATSLGRTTVHVADGVYDESIDLVNGISLRGGYRPDTWERHVESTATTVMGNTGSGHRKTLRALGISAPTTVEGFVIYGENNPEPGGNSYAVYVAGSTALSLSGNRIFAGQGGTGTDGIDGAGGPSGQAGQSGLPAFDTGQSPCVSLNRAGGAGGTLTHLGQVLDGGAGGNAVCPPSYDTQSSAHDGEGGSGPSPGSGGAAAVDRSLNTSGQCYLPTFGPNEATAGADGADGSHGSGGTGAVSAVGSVAGGEWNG
ncbi:MAG: hypothetical protein IH621_15370, partial [Krumholzibacteria bacterium]|nr:hypothetical protein [Candidatus Krumholzibacteria bacterium]